MVGGQYIPLGTANSGIVTGSFVPRNTAQKSKSDCLSPDGVSYPQVPTGYELGIGCAAQSYDGKIGFGITSDADAAPDAERFRDFLKFSF